MNTQQQSELKVFSSRATQRENGREKSLGSEFKLSRNCISVTKTQIKIFPQCLISQDTKIKETVQK